MSDNYIQSLEISMVKWSSPGFVFLRLWVHIWVTTSCSRVHFWADPWVSLLELLSSCPEQCSLQRAWFCVERDLVRKRGNSNYNEVNPVNFNHLLNKIWQSWETDILWLHASFSNCYTIRSSQFAVWLFWCWTILDSMLLLFVSLAVHKEMVREKASALNRLSESLHSPGICWPSVRSCASCCLQTWRGNDVWWELLHVIVWRELFYVIVWRELFCVIVWWELFCVIVWWLLVCVIVSVVFVPDLN